MSRFEYLRRITIGQYLPLDSLIHHLDPRAKMLGFLLLVLAITLANTLPGLLVALALALLIGLAAKMPLPYLVRSLLPPLPFLVLLALVQVFISRHNPASLPVLAIWRLMVYPEGLIAGAALLIRFAALLILLTVATGTLSTLEMIHGVDLLLKPLHRVGLATDAIPMLVQITLRFIPFLAISAEKIAKSQASRGADWDSPKGGLFRRIRLLYPLIIPLFVNSLRQAETLSDAMLARAYGAVKTRTSMTKYALTWRDGIWLLLCLVSVWVILSLRYPVFPGAFF